tara:strand:+ start:452 stop:748 length:297 start_codon:yes stop_codon:yes gene_type:complete
LFELTGITKIQLRTPYSYQFAFLGSGLIAIREPVRIPSADKRNPATASGVVSFSKAEARQYSHRGSGKISGSNLGGRFFCFGRGRGSDHGFEFRSGPF